MAVTDLWDHVGVSAGSAESVKCSVASDLVPSPVGYHVILPPAGGGGLPPRPLPLILALHGGDGGTGIARVLSSCAAFAWKARLLPPCVLAAPLSGRSFWMDTFDGAAKWETFLLGPFIDELVRTLPVDGARERLAVAGLSMGGLGTLRLACKHPDRFAAAAALEAAIDPALTWPEVDAERSWFRSPDLIAQIYGSPVDANWFEQNNPPAIALANREAIIASRMALYFECGDEDMLRLHHGAEFLHRLLWDNGIRHEYHLVRGADHIGRTLPRRIIEALAFIGRAFEPDGPDPQALALRRFGPVVARLLDGRRRMQARRRGARA